MSGFSGSFQYSAGEGEPTSNSGLGSAGLFYNNGPIYVGAAYQWTEDLRGNNLDDKGWSIAGSYNFGVVRPALVYDYIKYETPTGDLHRDFWGASVHAPIGGSGVLFLFYGQASDGKGSAATGTSVGTHAPVAATRARRRWEISYAHWLSKRTQAYAGYVKIDNDCNANYSFNINPYPVGRSGGETGCYGKPEGWVLGMVHLF